MEAIDDGVDELHSPPQGGFLHFGGCQMTATPTQPGQVVFYRHDGTIVTNNYFSANGHLYPIGDLSHIGTVRGSLHAGVVTAMAAFAVEGAAFAVLLTQVHTPAVLLLAAAALLVPCVVGAICAYRWPPQRRLVAYYKGWTVTLFASRNQLVYNQVTRAVQRAIAVHNAGGFRSAATGL